MSSPQLNFGASLSLTHIGTATAIIHLNHVNLITDPVFSPAGGEWTLGEHTLRTTLSAALTLPDLPPIDAVLLSHEDHPDNLDEPGRQLLDGRHVLTTPDAASKLAPRPGVRALLPWESTTLSLGGRIFTVTGTPCVHLPGGEVVGFIITTPEFGETDGLPNAIYFSGDTIYLPELAKMKEKWHISVAMLNIGNVLVPHPEGGALQITMAGVDAAKLFRDIGADVLVPMHFESWAHFTEGKEELKGVLEKEGLGEKVIWLEPGVKTKIV
ncbi:mitochondrial N-acyl-phosphatidylethanolamine-hydrolyzing phospholipase D [Podospora aff. communis PSN243]|uniref:Mitochondrial N-acyl-phosphatidylethanolamine-hydrolyzing phospholipase D n=1 Tax=Podospora aff. communis PSN243 TaxID=3040156 RepID=A0AAV9GVM9_9PEZI|nr:mitochondrial N-acyl-phosphatidylethanolamine-hydrolyzing phospholipase D [Podospora aff. communis PSN243]